MTRRTTVRWAAAITVLADTALAFRVVAWRPLPVPATGVAADVEAIVFLVDIGAMPPGTDGVIWLDDLGVY